MMAEFSGIGKLLIVSGVVLIVAGLLVMVAGKIPYLGKLPGDISIQRENFSFHFPVVTCLVVSVIVTVLLNLFFRK